MTGQEQLLHRSVASTSPFHRDDYVPPPRPDTSTAVTCPQCRARFISIGERSAETNLAGHIESKHGPRRGPKTEDGAAAIELVRTTVISQIGSGELKPGQVLSLSRLRAELGVSRHYVEVAVEQLVAAGTLCWSDAASVYNRRACVAR